MSRQHKSPHLNAISTDYPRREGETCHSKLMGLFFSLSGSDMPFKQGYAEGGNFLAPFLKTQ